mgnify:CR=1 FL=1
MSVFDPRLIDICLEVSDKEDTIRKIARLYKEIGVIQDANLFYSKIMEREKSLSTGIGYGIAVPHLRDETVRELKAGIYLLDREIDYDSLDRKKVKLVVSFAIPAQGGNEYMKILQKVCKFLHDESNRRSVFSCPDRDSLLQTFRSLEK